MAAYRSAYVCTMYIDTVAQQGTALLLASIDAAASLSGSIQAKDNPSLIISN